MTVRRGLIALVTVALVAGCGESRMEVRSGDDASDQGRRAVLAAIAEFVDAGRTAEAYADLAATIAVLRPGMSEGVADLAELHLAILALAPVEQWATSRPDQQTEALATTVWPVALAAPIRVVELRGGLEVARVAHLRGESTAAYVRRVCDGPYASTCRHLVPEWQGAVLGTEAIIRLAARARVAVARCVECTTPAWADAVDRWQELDRRATRDRRRLEALGAPDRWPVAGPAAVAWPAVTATLEIDRGGAWLLDGTALPTADRAAALAAVRGPLAVHLDPRDRVATLRALVTVAAGAGIPELIVAARIPNAPWDLRAYRVATTTRDPALSRRDTIQLYLRRRDTAETSGPLTRGGKRKVRSTDVKTNRRAPDVKPNRRAP